MKNYRGESIEQISGNRNFRLFNCDIPEKVYCLALGENAYLAKCKEYNLKPSPAVIILNYLKLQEPITE